MAKSDLIRQAAAKGFLGHSALLDPQGYTDQVLPSVLDQVMENQSQIKQSDSEYQENPNSIDDREEIDTGETSGLIAKNDTNAFGLEDRLKTKIIKESDANSGINNIRTKARRDQNEKMLKQGYSPTEISHDEQNNPMD